MSSDDDEPNRQVADQEEVVIPEAQPAPVRLQQPDTALAHGLRLLEQRYGKGAGMSLVVSARLSV